jgi:hypothetical protein
MSMSAIHGFLMMGTNKLFLCHLPMFYMPPHSFQVILQADLPNNDMASYIKIRNENPGKPLIIQNVEEKALKDLSNPGSFDAQGYFADPDGNTQGDPFLESTIVTNKKSLLFEPLNPNSQYPESLTYYLYGSNSDFHLSHVITKKPNFQQELDVTLSGDISNKVKEPNFVLAKLLIPSLTDKPSLDATGYPKESLTLKEYQVRMDDGTSGGISVGNNFYVNNWTLNGLSMPTMNM